MYLPIQKAFKAVNRLAEAIHHLAEALEGTKDRHAEEEPEHDGQSVSLYELRARNDSQHNALMQASYEHGQLLARFEELEGQIQEREQELEITQQQLARERAELDRLRADLCIEKKSHREDIELAKQWEQRIIELERERGNNGQEQEV